MIAFHFCIKYRVIKQNFLRLCNNYKAIKGERSLLQSAFVWGEFRASAKGHK